MVDESNGVDAVLGRYVDDEVAWQYLATPIVLEGDASGDEVLFDGVFRRVTYKELDPYEEEQDGCDRGRRRCRKIISARNNSSF